MMSPSSYPCADFWEELPITKEAEELAEMRDHFRHGMMTKEEAEELEGS
jgi:hypothetical protein